jgi:hypothetical protein
LEFEGLTYPSVEHAFQAAKLKTNQSRLSAGFTDRNLTFKDAKRLGRNVTLRDDWKDIREYVMLACLRSKFSNADLAAKLKATGKDEIIDGHWGSPDLIWGYHYPSQAGENRLGKLLMELREELYGCAPPKTFKLNRAHALYHLDWPLKCLHDGLPIAYRERICKLAADCTLIGSLCILPRRKICIALSGEEDAIQKWEMRMTTENVDVNSKGRPCRERMLAQLLWQKADGIRAIDGQFSFAQVESWAELQRCISSSIDVDQERICTALGPEAPPLPTKISYTRNREGVMLDGRFFPLCLNDNEAHRFSDPLLGDPASQTSFGVGEEVPLVYEGKSSIFGGRFARVISAVLQPDECRILQELAEKIGFGLAGSRGFNPFARFALRCLIDAPLVAAAMTERLKDLLPQEYPAQSGRQLIGINERLRFLKYTPGMHHGGDHTDCAHEDEKLGRSFLTVQLYLNSDFSGGRTTFISNRLVPIEPAAGKIAVFDHELYHRGGQVTQGTKYAVRMDVLYSHPHSAQKQSDTTSDWGTARSMYGPSGGRPPEHSSRRRWNKR